MTIQELYPSLEVLKAHDEMIVVAGRLGFGTCKEAWDDNAIVEVEDKWRGQVQGINFSMTPSCARRVIKYDMLCRDCQHGETIQWVDKETGLLLVECCACHEVNEYAVPSNPTHLDRPTGQKEQP